MNNAAMRKQGNKAIQDYLNSKTAKRLKPTVNSAIRETNLTAGQLAARIYAKGVEKGDKERI